MVVYNMIIQNMINIKITIDTIVYDALSDLVLCGETDMTAAGIRKSINSLKKSITTDTITGFQKEFQVAITNTILKLY